MYTAVVFIRSPFEIDLIAPEMIKFGIESKLSSALTSTDQFKDAVALALADMRRILLHIEGQQMALL